MEVCTLKKPKKQKLSDEDLWLMDDIVDRLRRNLLCGDISQQVTIEIANDLLASLRRRLKRAGFTPNEQNLVIHNLDRKFIRDLSQLLKMFSSRNGLGVDRDKRRADNLLRVLKILEPQIPESLGN